MGSRPRRRSLPKRAGTHGPPFRRRKPGTKQSLLTRHTPRSKKTPAVMASVGLNLSFPTRVVEWMDKPLYGGLVKETIHVESLLTPKQSKVSHPYLPLVGEGKVKLDGAVYYVKR